MDTDHDGRPVNRDGDMSAVGFTAWHQRASMKALARDVQAIADNDCAEFAGLLGLLLEHPAVDGNATLLGGVSGIRHQFTIIWEKIERIAESVSNQKSSA